MRVLPNEGASDRPVRRREKDRERDESLSYSSSSASREKERERDRDRDRDRERELIKYPDNEKMIGGVCFRPFYTQGFAGVEGAKIGTGFVGD